MTERVIITGAGLSGLYAASLLEQAGVDYVILEARERTGGRVLSGEVLTGTSPGLHVDLGPAWFWPDMQPELAQLINRLGLTRIAQTRPGDMLIERQQHTPPQRYPAYASSPESYRLQGGMQSLTSALKKQIPAEKRLLNHQVVAISRHDGDVQVECSNGATLRAKHLFLALPPALAAKMAFTPALPDGLLSSWRKTPTWMAPHAKYVAVYRTDFLSSQQLSGDASSQVGPMVEIHDVSQPDSGFTTIFGFIGVPAKTRWTVSEAMLKQLCREQLVRLFGQDAAAPETEFLKDWAADPFTATEVDLQQTVGHSLAQPVPAQGAWAGKLTAIASEWSPHFSGYLAGAVDAAGVGVQRWLGGQR